METLWQDLKYGARVLARSPGFTAVAVLTLALGIGANTAIFSVVNAVLLRPLPFQKADQLVFLQETARRETVETRPLSYPDFLSWRERATSFNQMAAWDQVTITLSGEQEAERVTAEAVSANYFSVLGARPILGRAFLPGEDGLPEGSLVAILGHDLWQRLFSGDPQIVGRNIRLDGRTFTVIGVAPKGFGGIGEGVALWIPFTSNAARQQHLDMRGARYFFAVGRLRAGVTLGQAQAELDNIAARLEREYADTNQDRGVRLLSLTDAFFEDFEQPLFVLFVAVGFVLLIAAANVANLALARVTARQHEVAIRVSLGASTLRIARLVLTESVLLSAVGGLCGLVLAYWSTDLLVSMTTELPGIVEVRLDGVVLSYAFMLVALTGLLSGLAPALQLSRTCLNDNLWEGGRNPTSSPAQNRVRHALVVVELTLAFVLLIGGSLLLNTLRTLLTLDLGFQSEQVLTARISLPQQEYSAEQARVFAHELLDRVAALPSIEASALASDYPLDGRSSALFMTVEGRPLEDRASKERVFDHSVSPEFFRILQIPLRQGRFFSPMDVQGGQPVAIVSEAAARQFWPGENPLGKKLIRGSFDPGDSWWTVVGVVGDVRYRTLVGSQNDDPDIYFPLPQVFRRELGIVLRSTADPGSMSSSLRSVIRERDPHLPVFEVATMESLLDRATAQPRATATLLGAFALTALVLASVGIYGVMSYSVSRRTHEISLRVALGARSIDILWLVLGQGMALTLVGIGVGLLAALSLTRFLATLLFQVSPTDPLTYAGVSLLLTGVALTACWVPARRATRVDPMVALRHE